MDSVHSRSWTWPTAMALALLAACGGDNLGPEEPTVPSRISGLLFGTVTRSNQTYQMFAFANNGRFMAVDGGGVFYDGTYSVDGGQISDVGGLRIYASDPVGRPFIRQVSETAATLSASVTTAGWNGTIGAAAGNYSLNLDYQLPEDAQDSSLTFIDNTWVFTSGTYESTLTIQTNGATATSNTDNNVATGCNSSGAASIIDANFGTYGWQTTLSGANCGAFDDLPYSGFGVLTEGTAPLDTLTVYLANANFFLAYSPYRRQP